MLTKGIFILASRRHCEVGTLPNLGHLEGKSVSWFLLMKGSTADFVHWDFQGRFLFPYCLCWKCIQTYLCIKRIICYKALLTELYRRKLVCISERLISNLTSISLLEVERFYLDRYKVLMVN